jgi:hypothetical protein
LGILTTGVEWRFFTDLDNKNVMDTEPFLVWNVLKDAIPYDFLNILQRAKFDSGNTKTFAEQRYRQSLLVAELSAVLKPSPEFVKLAIQNLEELGDRHLTAPVIEKWKPILTRAIEEWAKQKVLTMALDRASDTLGVDSAAPTEDGGGTEDEAYLEFWKPIRTESDGLFAGKPAGGAWIDKRIRGICISLIVHNHECRVDLNFGENKQERRDKALELFPAATYPRELHETPKGVSARFPVLDKGIKDRDHWPDIREKLTKLGADFYYRIKKDSGV